MFVNFARNIYLFKDFSVTDAGESPALLKIVSSRDIVDLFL